MGVRVQIPMSVICDNLSLRCVHTFFDPYSEFAKSYDFVSDKPMNDFNAGIMDIEDCLINEWLMQESIAQKLIREIEHKLMLFEIAVRYVYHRFLINIYNCITELLMEKEIKRVKKPKKLQGLMSIQI